MTTPTARDTVLGRIRDALALAPTPAAEVPRAYRTGRTLPDGERLALLTDRLVDYKAEVHPCTGDRTAEVIAGILREHDARRIGVPDGLDEEWLSAFDGEVQRDSADIPAPSLDALDGVVTASAVSCAETGTIFLDGSSGQGKRALPRPRPPCLRRRPVLGRGRRPRGDRPAGAGEADDPDQRAVGHVRHRTGAGGRRPRPP